MHAKCLLPFTATLGFCLLAIFSGCSEQTAKSSGASDSSEAHHNLSLHKPKNLSAAVSRMVELHESLISSDAFPEPAKIKYVEVIHGMGPGGHSHFYLESEYDPAAGHEEQSAFPGEEVESEEVKHLVAEVDCRTELKDITGWLPDIAAWGESSESDWKVASNASKRLQEILDAIPEDASDASFRDSWKAKSKEVEVIFDELKAIVAGGAGEAK